jgi:soluble lytic murein transglycosylase-like protein
VVRADRRTGRLVRTVVVTPQAVPPVVVQPRLVTPPAPSRTPAPADRPDLVGYAAQMARRYDVDPLLVHSVIQVESGYNPYAISSKGARGVMQLMPRTARRLEVANSFDPFQNIDGGVRYLRYLLDLFNSERLAVAAYNAGEGAVFRHGNVPPYPETIHYVRQVAKTVGAARQAAQKPQTSPTRVSPAPAHPPIRHYTDSQGKVHYETRSGP